jgi:hypothetical protein
MLGICIAAVFMVRIFRLRNYVIVLLTMCISALSTGGSGLTSFCFLQSVEKFMELHLLRCAQMGFQRLLRIMRLEGTKLRIVIKMGIPTMFSGVRMMSSNVFMCLEDASLLFSCKCRPFGAAAILGGYDRDGPQLYMIEPSGVAYVCSHLQPSDDANALSSLSSFRHGKMWFEVFIFFLVVYLFYGSGTLFVIQI